MAQHPPDSGPTDLVQATTELKESLEGMSTNLDDLSAAMRDVADGYDSFGPEETESSPDFAGPAANGRQAADD